LRGGGSTHRAGGTTKRRATDGSGLRGLLKPAEPVLAGDIRVAIVDDEEPVAQVLKEILVGAGCTVSAMAHTYEDAVALVEHRGVCDIIFVDLGLGGKPAGINVAHHAVRAGLAVVVMTGGASLPDALAGAGLLLKPFSVESVHALLHTLRRQEGPIAAA